MWEEDGGGPFYGERNGVSVLNREGARRHFPRPQPLKLDVCGSSNPRDGFGSADCNNRLNQRFENRGRPVVEAVWRGKAVLGSRSVRAFALWWTKTLLLADHPGTRNTFPGLERGETRHAETPGTREPLLPYLRGPDLLPPDLSLWLAVSHDEVGMQQLEDHCMLQVPHVKLGSRPKGRGHVMMAGPGLLRGGTRLLFQLVHHPYCDVVHPFEEAALAVRLWPDPPDRLDIEALPKLSPAGREQFWHQFGCGGIGAWRSEDDGRFLIHACKAHSAWLPWPLCGCTTRPPKSASTRA